MRSAGRPGFQSISRNTLRYTCDAGSSQPANLQGLVMSLKDSCRLQAVAAALRSLGLTGSPSSVYPPPVCKSRTPKQAEHRNSGVGRLDVIRRGPAVADVKPASLPTLLEESQSLRCQSIMSFAQETLWGHRWRAAPHGLLLSIRPRMAQGS